MKEFRCAYIKVGMGTFRTAFALTTREEAALSDGELLELAEQRLDARIHELMTERPDYTADREIHIGVVAA